MAQTYEIDIKRFNGQDYDTLLPTPADHAATHQANGSDPLVLQAGNYGTASIPTSAYQDASVTAAKVAPDAIDTPNVKNRAITQEKLAEDIEFGVTIDKLWQNAQIASAFNAQTISLSLSGYDLIKILGNYDASSGSIMAVIEIPNVTNRTGYLFAFDDSGSYSARRQVKRVSSGIQFFSANGGNPSADATVNNYMCIPYAIYGIKGVG